MDITFEGISFNVDSFRGMTEEEFIKRGMLPGKQGLYHRHPDDVRQKLIKEAFKLINSFEKPNEKEAAAVPSPSKKRRKKNG